MSYTRVIRITLAISGHEEKAMSSKKGQSSASVQSVVIWHSVSNPIRLDESIPAERRTVLVGCVDMRCRFAATSDTRQGARTLRSLWSTTVTPI